MIKIGEKYLYVFNNGDTELLTVLELDHKGSAWVEWNKDGFINMVPVNRLRKVL